MRNKKWGHLELRDDVNDALGFNSQRGEIEEQARREAARDNLQEDNSSPTRVSSLSIFNMVFAERVSNIGLGPALLNDNAPNTP